MFHLMVAIALPSRVTSFPIMLHTTQDELYAHVFGVHVTCRGGEALVRVFPRLHRLVQANRGCEGLVGAARRWLGPLRGGWWWFSWPMSVLRG